MKQQPADFIRANTSVLSPPHVPEIRLHLAHEAHDLWQKTEDELNEIGLPPPFWAFAWAGGQGLARTLLDQPELVRGRRVVDFASGSGLVAIAAHMAGASSVLAADIDLWSRAAIELNAGLNGVRLDIADHDLLGTVPETDVLLAGDVFYDRDLADRLVPWFVELSKAGIDVLVGDPGRAYCPADRLTALAVHEVPVTRALEDSEIKRTTVFRFTA